MVLVIDFKYKLLLKEINPNYCKGTVSLTLHILSNMILKSVSKYLLPF
jgi:hypothetical protein